MASTLVAPFGRCSIAPSKESQMYSEDSGFDFALLDKKVAQDGYKLHRIRNTYDLTTREALCARASGSTNVMSLG